MMRKKKEKITKSGSRLKNSLEPRKEKKMTRKMVRMMVLMTHGTRLPLNDHSGYP